MNCNIYNNDENISITKQIKILYYQDYILNK
jgi:hypothetical protein